MNTDDRRRVLLNGMSRSIQRMRMIIEDEMPPCLAISELNLMELRLANIRSMSSEWLVEQLLRHLNLDGIDPNSLTIGEIRRALPAQRAFELDTTREPRTGAGSLD